MTPTHPAANVYVVEGVASVTLWQGKHDGCWGSREMNRLSHVMDQRPMLRVAGEILLAFCFVTPLMLVVEGLRFF